MEGGHARKTTEAGITLVLTKNERKRQEKPGTVVRMSIKIKRVMSASISHETAWPIRHPSYTGSRHFNFTSFKLNFLA